jgi:hypothetical protein
MRGKFINDKIFFWNLVVFFVFSRVRVRVRRELASNFQGRFRFCTIGRRLVIQADDSGMEKMQVASICRACFTSRTKEKYPEDCTLAGNPKLFHLFLKSLFHFSQILFFNQLHKSFEITSISDQSSEHILLGDR